MSHLNNLKTSINLFSMSHLDSLLGRPNIIRKRQRDEMHAFWVYLWTDLCDDHIKI